MLHLGQQVHSALPIAQGELTLTLTLTLTTLPQVHSALPISEGERLNLVVWMRSARWRREHGCPMCDQTGGLFPVQ